MGESLSIVDYVIFIGSLVGALVIGVWSAFKSRRDRSTRAQSTARSDATEADELVRSKELSMGPVALSLAASFLSALLIVGYPAEVYAYGAGWMVSMFGIFIAIIGAYYIFVPVMYPLELKTVLQYFELRYEGSAVKVVAASSFMLSSCLYMGGALYAPVVALSSMTHFPEWAAIVLAGSICTTYSAIGGLKGVVLTDVFQICIMFGSMMTIFVYAVVQAGGIAAVFQACAEFDRTQLFNFSVDPYVRMTFWSAVSNVALMWLYVLGGGQASFQRYASMRTLKRAQRVLLLNIPGILILVGLAFLTGFALFGFYAHCDPMLTNDIKKPDEILPHFVLTEMGHFYGLPGIFIASLFGGGLSTLSSGLNALASVAWEEGILMTAWGKSLSPDRKLLAVRLLGFLFGVIAIGLALLSSTLGSIVQVNVALTTTVASPLLAMFLVSMFLPFVNKTGVLSGAAASFAVAGWIAFGVYFDPPPSTPRLPSSIDGCDFSTANSTLIPSVRFTPLTDVAKSERSIYHISYLLYIHCGTAAGLLGAITVGLLSGGLKTVHKNPNVFHPVVRRFVKTPLPKDLEFSKRESSDRS